MRSVTGLSPDIMCAMRNVEADRLDATSMLRAELDKLKRKLQITDELELVWRPDDKREVSGEVKGHVIYLYDATPSSASATLRHEVVDYVVSQAIEPFKEFANELVRALNKAAYKRKEEVVERLLKLLEE